MDDQQDQHETQWLRASEAASLARVSRWTIWRAAHAGELLFAIVGGERFFVADDVTDWAAARQTAATTAPRGDNASGRAAT